MDNKIVKVIFEEGWETMYNTDLTQGDYGQVLQIEGITLPDGNVEVHFSLAERNGEAPISIGSVKDNVITVNIPDFIFQKKDVYTISYEAYAWIYVTDGDSGRTIRKIVFTIDTRAKSTTNVPEAQQDQFLQEVRQVMTETKEIAQSVRDDADNGEFDGEKGEKGDAGSIKFVIVTELPTEDIDTSAIYLVPTEIETEQNKFQEYVYTDDGWECIGSASVEVKLDDYVKKDDYAVKNGNHGLVKIDDSFGVGLPNGASNPIAVICATEQQVKDRTGTYKPINSSLIDLVVQEGLVNSKLEWTDEQKQLARALLDAIGSEDYASKDVAGVIKVLSGTHGLNLNTTNGLLMISQASKEIIDERTNVYKPITPINLDYAVKKALSDCKLSGDDAWTDEEKAKTLELLGGMLKPKTPVRNSVVTMGGDGVINTTTMVHESATPWSIPLRDDSGNIATGTPTKNIHATTKKYVDDGFVAKIQEADGVTKGEIYTNKYNNVTQRDTVQLDGYNQAGKYSVPSRNSLGGIYIPDEALEDDSVIPSGQVAVNKKYVDDLVAKLRAEIEALKG